MQVPRPRRDPENLSTIELGMAFFHGSLPLVVGLQVMMSTIQNLPHSGLSKLGLRGGFQASICLTMIGMRALESDSCLLAQTWNLRNTQMFC